MRNIPTALKQEKNALFTPDPWLVLLDVKLDENTTLYYVSNSEDVTFSGQVYTAWPFLLEPARQAGKGEIPKLALRLCNTGQVPMAYIEDLDGAVGSEIVIRVVNAGHLTENYSELEWTFNILATECDAEWITFTLGAASPLRMRFPLNRYYALHCNWEFQGLECAYSGGQTECDRTFKRCEELNNTARFGGYMGLSQKGYRII